MDEYNYEEILASAEAAFGNKQYQVSLEYYQKALEKKPDDLYVLSRAGSICVVLGQYNYAFKYFLHAAELDPNNGDNYYNLGNAYYFIKDYAKCLDMYTKAEMIGCSPDVLSKLYFQKAMLCGARGDAKSALMYLKKYERAHADDVKSIDPRVLTEKVNLQMALHEYEEAELTAAKLLNIQPTRFENYILYFNLLMALKKYDKAEQVLIDAQDYAELSDKDKYVLGIQKAAFYTELISVFANDEETKARCEKFATEIYNEMLSSDNPDINKNEVKINLANLYMKAKRYDNAIVVLKEFLPAEEIVHCDADLSPVQDIPEYTEEDDNLGEHEYGTEVAPDYADYKDEKTDYADYSDEIPDYANYYEEPTDYTYYDEKADSDVYSDSVEPELTDYEEDKADELNNEEENNGESEIIADVVKESVPDDVLERVRYILMSCYVSKEDYLNALSMAKYLKDSQNIYYQYFSRYCEAYAIRCLAGNSDLYTKESGEQKYAETIAFYRSRMMKNPKDKYAIILRSRMYAEQGSYVKAEEMTKLLGSEERNSLNEYIEQCRSSNESNI